MNRVIIILFVAHDEKHPGLIQRELKKGTINCLPEVVQTAEDYAKALKNFIPDIILSDFNLPEFDGPRAFAMREEMASETPFIFVSGTIGEESSIEFIKSGLTDYVLKDRFFTLTTQVNRALKICAQTLQESD